MLFLPTIPLLHFSYESMLEKISLKRLLKKHRKSTNLICKQMFIHLLQDFNAKISDFGLAKLGPSGGDSHVTTRIMGTYGYAAPEYVATGDHHIYTHS